MKKLVYGVWEQFYVCIPPLVVLIILLNGLRTGAHCLTFKKLFIKLGIHILLLCLSFTEIKKSPATELDWKIIKTVRVFDEWQVMSSLRSIEAKKNALIRASSSGVLLSGPFLGEVKKKKKIIENSRKSHFGQGGAFVNVATGARRQWSHFSPAP